MPTWDSVLFTAAGVLFLTVPVVLFCRWLVEAWPGWRARFQAARLMRGRDWDAELVELLRAEGCYLVDDDLMDLAGEVDDGRGDLTPGWSQ